MSDLFDWAARPSEADPRQAGNIPVSWMYHPLFDPIGQALFEDHNRQYPTRLPEGQKHNWDTLTDMGRASYRDRARHHLAILLDWDTFKPKDFTSYMVAARVALERMEFLSHEPGWEDYLRPALRQRIADKIRAAGIHEGEGK